jgi:GNAT superfamily N-acetyltransferase
MNTFIELMEVSIHTSAPGCTTDRIGYLEAWYVDPVWLGKGAGRALVQAAENWARSQGCTEMASDTNPDYPGHPERSEGPRMRKHLRTLSHTRYHSCTSDHAIRRRMITTCKNLSRWS